MIKARYRQCEYDNCVYFKQNDYLIYLLLYVDDILIASRNKTQIQKLKGKLKRKFDMKDLGEGKKILSMKITRDRGSCRLWLTQENHVLKVLEKFNTAKARLITALLASHFKLYSKQCPQLSEEEEEMSRVPYASVVGLLIYVMVCTKPNLAYAISRISRFMSNLRK